MGGTMTRDELIEATLDAMGIAPSLREIGRRNLQKLLTFEIQEKYDAAMSHKEITDAWLKRFDEGT